MRILFLLVVLSVTSALQSQVVIKENAIQSKYAFSLGYFESESCSSL